MRATYLSGLACGLGGELLARSFASSRLSSGLLINGRWKGGVVSKPVLDHNNRVRG